MKAERLVLSACTLALLLFPLLVTVASPVALSYKWSPSTLKGYSSVAIATRADGDANPEIVAGDEDGYVHVFEWDDLLNVFVEVWTSPQHNSPIYALGVADLDGNGLEEIYVGVEGFLLAYEWNYSSLSYELKYQVETFVHANDLVAGVDSDGDGIEEVVIGFGAFPGTGYSTYNGTAVYELSAGTLVQVFNETQHEYPVYAVAVLNDTDGDGGMEIASGEYASDYTGYIKVADCVGDNAYNVSEYSISHYGVSSIAYANDLDGDGLSEMVVGSYYGYVHVFEFNATEGEYVSAWHDYPLDEVYDVTICDINGDGLEDLVVVGANDSGDPKAIIYTATGDDAFEAKWSSTLEGDPDIAMSVDAGDPDADGAANLVFGCYNPSVVACYEYIGEEFSPVDNSYSLVWESQSYSNDVKAIAHMVLNATQMYRVLYVAEGSTLHIYNSTGDNAFAEIGNVTFAATINDLFVIAPWLVVASGTEVYLCNVTGAVNYTISVGATVNSVFAGYADPDMLMDVVVGASDSVVYVYEYNSTSDSFDLVWNSGAAFTAEVNDVVIAYDLDGDLANEIVAGSDDDYVKVFECTGDNAYSEVWSDYIGYDVLSVAAGYDLDGDGYNEILVGDYYYYVSIYECTGDNAYSYVYYFTVGYYTVWRIVTNVDLDQDGNYDIIASAESGSYSGNVEVDECTGDNAYSEVWSYSTAAYENIYALDSGELDKDSLLEIYAGGENGKALVFENEGAVLYRIEYEWFSSPLTGIPPSTVYTIAVADADSDGSMDILVGEYSGYLRIFENTGDDSYEQVWLYSFNASVSVDDVEVGDLDADGAMEIAVACGYYVYIFDCVADDFYTLSWFQDLGDDVRALCIADLNGDGLNELFAGRDLGYADGMIHVFAWNSTSMTYEEVWSTVTTDWVHALGAGDIDSDGHPELVACAWDGNVTIYNVTAGDYTLEYSYDYGDLGYDYYPPGYTIGLTYMRSGVIVDLDGDNYGEVVLPMDEHVVVMEATGPDAYDPLALDIDVGAKVYAATVCFDFDDNGYAEIVFGGEDDTVHVYEYSGLGTYTEVWNHTFAGTICDIAAASRWMPDLDGDGCYEVVVGTSYSSRTEPTLYLFEEETSVPTVPELPAYFAAMFLSSLIAATAVMVKRGK